MLNNQLGYLSLDIVFSRKLTAVRCRKTVRSLEHIMSADKYPNIFPAKWRLLFIYLYSVRAIFGLYALQLDNKGYMGYLLSYLDLVTLILSLTDNFTLELRRRNLSPESK